MGLLQLVRDVRDQFTDDGVTAAVLLGEREVARKINQGPGQANRVVFVPVGGKYGPPRNPGRNPRPLRTWLATAEVHVWAWDSTATDDEEKQYEAVWQLHDALIRAIYLKAHGTFEIANPRWTRTPIELKFGKEVVFDLEVQVPILDTPWPTVAGGTITPAGEGSMVFPQGVDSSGNPIPDNSTVGCGS